VVFKWLDAKDCADLFQEMHNVGDWKSSMY